MSYCQFEEDLSIFNSRFASLAVSSIFLSIEKRKRKIFILGREQFFTIILVNIRFLTTKILANIRFFMDDKKMR